MSIYLFIIVLLILPVLFDLLFPFKRPNLENYFSPGQTFMSESEGLIQKVLEQNGDKVFNELRLLPGASGPPEHKHETFDESISIAEGTLTVKLYGKVKVLHAGERLFLPAGHYHQFYNETEYDVILRPEENEDYVPIEFAYSLAQIYPLMSSDGKLSFNMFIKMCVLDDLLDVIPKGPPPALFKIIKKVIKPYARLFGVTPYDNKSRPY